MADQSPERFFSVDPEYSDATMSSLMRGLAAGDDDAYSRFWSLYGDRLRGLAGSRLPAYLRNRLEADDVVQSACRSFFRRMTGGDFKVSDAENLWRLLCAMTLNKVRMQIRFHLRQRRSPKREVPMDSSREDALGAAREPEAVAASPEDLAIFAEQLELLMSALSDEERGLVELKLRDHTTEEIASRLDCSERTVRRLLQRVRDRWQSQLEKSLDEGN